MRDTKKPGDMAQGSQEEARVGAPDGVPDNATFSAAPPAQVEPADEDWPESEQLAQAEVSVQEMVAYGTTVRRIEFLIAVVGFVCAAAVAWPLGWIVSAGVAVGTVLGWINFRWLAASVNAIGERIVKVKSQERGAAVVARGVGRIFLMALFAYGIFTYYSLRGLIGFLAGLSMPVIALMCEAVYELVARNRRSF